MDKFETFLQSLGNIMGIPLVADTTSSCLIVFGNNVSIQIELDKPQENLIIGTLLGEVPPGKYRENLLIEALKNNRALDLIFAYSLRKNQLVLFKKQPFQTVSAETVLPLLHTMTEIAFIWKEAISHQEIPSTGMVPNSKISPFSIRS